MIDSCDWLDRYIGRTLLPWVHPQITNEQLTDWLLVINVLFTDICTMSFPNCLQYVLLDYIKVDDATQLKKNPIHQIWSNTSFVLINLTTPHRSGWPKNIGLVYRWGFRECHGPGWRCEALPVVLEYLEFKRIIEHFFFPVPQMLINRPTGHESASGRFKCVGDDQSQMRVM